MNPFEEDLLREYEDRCKEKVEESSQPIKDSLTHLPIPVKLERTDDGWKQITVNFRSPTQLPSLMVLEEYYDFSGRIITANILFKID